MKSSIPLILGLCSVLSVPQEALTNQVIAQWDLVPGQLVSSPFKAGVIAFHETGVNVVFAVNDKEVAEVSDPTWNDRTGTFEYWIKIDPTAYPDGPIRLSAEAFPEATGSNLILPEVTLHANSEGTLALGQDVWVDVISGSDTSGNGTQFNPFASLSKGLSIVEDGGTVFLNPGLYKLTSMNGDAFTYWTTVRSAPNCSATDVQILTFGPDNSSSGNYQQSGIRWADVSIFCERPEEQGSLFVLDENDRVWFDGVILSDRNGSEGMSCLFTGYTAEAYITNSRIHSLSEGGGRFLRNVIFEDIAENALWESSDLTALNMDIIGSGNIAQKALLRSNIPGGLSENIVLYNVKAHKVETTGIFETNAALKNVAVVNLLLDPDIPGGSLISEYNGSWEHVLMWNITLPNNTISLLSTAEFTSVDFRNIILKSLLVDDPQSTSLRFEAIHIAELADGQTGAPGANSTIGDPLFAHPSSGDFRLRIDSPASTRGVLSPGVPADASGYPFSTSAPDKGAFARESFAPHQELLDIITSYITTEHFQEADQKRLRVDYQGNPSVRYMVERSRDLAEWQVASSIFADYAGLFAVDEMMAQSGESVFLRVGPDPVSYYWPSTPAPDQIYPAVPQGLIFEDIATGSTYNLTDAFRGATSSISFEIISNERPFDITLNGSILKMAGNGYTAFVVIRATDAAGQTADLPIAVNVKKHPGFVFEINDFSRDQTIFDSGAALAMTTRQVVEGLADPEATGSQWNGEYKIPGVATLPQGMSFNLSANVVTLSATFTGYLEGWDFTGCTVNWNSGEVRARHNIFGERNGVTGRFMYLRIFPEARIVDISYNTFEGPNTYGGAGIAIRRDFDGSGMDINAAGEGSVYRNRIINLTSDAYKMAGGDFFENYIKFDRNLPGEAFAWSPDATYQQGDLARNDRNHVFRSKTDNNVGNAVPSNKSQNANWENLDPHVDAITISATLGETRIFRNLIDMRAHPSASVGMTNAIRSVPNANTDFYHGPVLITENILLQSDHTPQPTVASLQNESPYFEADHFISNWIKPNNSGAYLYPAAPETLWIDNRDYATMTLIDEPSVTQAVKEAVSRFNRAEIPLSGTGTPGSLIQARAFSVNDDGATSTNWKDIARVDMTGNWHGVIHAPRSESWYKASARQVTGKEAPLTTETVRTFGVGHIVFFEEQSLLRQSLIGNDRFDGDTGYATFEPDDDQVHVVRIYNRGSVTDPDTGIVSAIVPVNSTTLSQRLAESTDFVISSHLSHMARVLMDNAPGEKFLLAFDVKSGTHMSNILRNTSADVRRSFVVSGSLASVIHQDGAKVGLFQHTHDREQDVVKTRMDEEGLKEIYLDNWLPEAIFGKDMHGNTITAPHSIKTSDLAYQNIGVNHLWPEIYPEFSDYTTVVYHRSGMDSGVYRSFVAGNREGDYFADPSTWDSIGHIVYGNGMHNFLQIESVRLVQERPFLRSRVLMAPLHDMTQRRVDDSHFSFTDTISGMRENMRIRAAMILWSFGYKGPRPTLDQIHWTPDYVELGCSLGNITTQAREYGLPPLDDSIAMHTEVLGFQYNGPNGQEYVHRTEIVNGKIRVYPKSGDTFDSNTRMYYGIGDSKGALSIEHNFENKTHRYRPIVKQGWVGDFKGFLLQAQPDMESINAANDL